VGTSHYQLYNNSAFAALGEQNAQSEELLFASVTSQKQCTTIEKQRQYENLPIQASRYAGSPLLRHLRSVLETEHEPVIQPYHYPVNGRCPQLLIKLCEHLRTGGDVADECLQDPHPALPLTLGRLQRRLCLYTFFLSVLHSKYLHVIFFPCLPLCEASPPRHTLYRLPAVPLCPCTGSGAPEVGVSRLP